MKSSFWFSHNHSYEVKSFSSDGAIFVKCMGEGCVSEWKGNYKKNWMPKLIGLALKEFCFDIELIESRHGFVWKGFLLVPGKEDVK